MRRPFYKNTLSECDNVREENTHIIKKVLEGMKRLGISLIEIPLVDSSSLQSEFEKEAFRKWLQQIVEDTDNSIYFALETDLNPHEFSEYLKKFHSGRVGANYDSGNSSGIGYDPYEEVITLKDHIFNIHIKDRIYHGPTVELGTGDADFEKLFRGLKEIGYRHNFILQAARGNDGEEEIHISNQMGFAKRYLKKYDI